jgi:hypothetical protein
MSSRERWLRSSLRMNVLNKWMQDRENLRVEAQSEYMKERS